MQYVFIYSRLLSEVGRGELVKTSLELLCISRLLQLAFQGNDISVTNLESHS